MADPLAAFEAASMAATTSDDLGALLDALAAEQRSLLVERGTTEFLDVGKRIREGKQAIWSSAVARRFGVVLRVRLIERRYSTSAP
jgi:hypothetical protein